MASENLSLSFGLELETIFCFHEDMLRRYLNKTVPGSDIVKSLGTLEPYLRHKGYPGRPYKSWAIKDESTLHPETKVPNVHDPVKGTFRAYIDEPANIVKALLQENSTHKNLPTYPLHSQKPTDYASWSICNDPSLAGISKNEMIEKLPHLVASPADAHNWDSWGIELVSPIYTDVTTALHETSEIVKIMTSTSATEYGTLATGHSALHIHVGQPDNSPFDLATLQHLAWLLVVFEDTIQLLHPTERRQIYSPTDGHTICEIQSMRDTWLLDSPTPVTRSIVDGATGESRPETWNQWYAPLATIKEDIFNGVSQQSGHDQQLARLVKYMSTNQRGHVVNFTGLTLDDRPNTVEFRQHAGTLDMEEVRWWISFCTGMVRAAHKRAQTGVAYGVESWEGAICLTLEDLFTELDLPEEARAFYRDLAAKNGPVDESMVFEAPFEDDLEELPLDEFEGLSIQARL